MGETVRLKLEPSVKKLKRNGRTLKFIVEPEYNYFNPNWPPVNARPSGDAQRRQKAALD